MKVKSVLYKIYGFLNSLLYPKILFSTLKSHINEGFYDNEEALLKASEWLLYMQNSDGGYSRKFSFISSRDKSYIETTGYIIPTMLEVGKFFKDTSFIDSALEAGEFLLSIQNKDGSFSEIDNNQPFAFDTGQCLIGLNKLYEYTQNKVYLEAAKKASYWLKEHQEKDGSWVGYAYNKEQHDYYIRVSSSMYHYGILAQDDTIKEVAWKHLELVLSHQLENGMFSYPSFLTTHTPFLHTLIYIAEGLLDFYDMTKDQVVLDAVLKFLDNFKTINLQRDLILCSQYDQDFTCVNKERCITGLAQWSGVALRLYGLTKDEEYKNSATVTLSYLKSKQIQGSIMVGGFSASVPFWGRYGGFDFVNWTNKFFIDALLLYQKYGISATKEQENYVLSAFRQTLDVVTEDFSFMDSKYLKMIEEILKDTTKPLKVLDVGAGKGVIVSYLQQKYPHHEFVGVDPVFSNEKVKKGSIYNLPFVDNDFDLVIALEVLQHTLLKEALSEIYRVSKKGAFFFIGERNINSILYLLKPFLELVGRWMYPYDGAFKEKWYTKSKWKYFLKLYRFEVEKIATIEGDGKKFVNRYITIMGRRI